MHKHEDCPHCWDFELDLPQLSMVQPVDLSLRYAREILEPHHRTRWALADNAVPVDSPEADALCMLRLNPLVQTADSQFQVRTPWLSARQMSGKHSLYLQLSKIPEV